MVALNLQRVNPKGKHTCSSATPDFSLFFFSAFQCLVVATTGGLDPLKRGCDNWMLKTGRRVLSSHFNKLSKRNTNRKGVFWKLNTVLSLSFGYWTLDQLSFTQMIIKSLISTSLWIMCWHCVHTRHRSVLYHFIRENNNWEDMTFSSCLLYTHAYKGRNTHTHPYKQISAT